MAKHRDPQVRVGNAYKGAKRVVRSPKFPFQLRSKPFQIQPFMCAPVLPGETMKNLVLQSRVVSKPLKHSLVGWWCEYYFFYVKLRDLEYHIGTDFLDGLVTAPGSYNPATIRTAIGAGADAKYYHAAGGTNWLKAALGSIVEYYFRDEGENWNNVTLDGMPLAQIQGRNWMDSLTLNDVKRTDRDFDLDLNSNGDLTATEFFTGMEQYNALRDAGLETMDYEDWIATFGVKVPERHEGSFNEHKPELIRYFRQWQYPVNTVEPTTGVPSAALSWVNAFRADKDRFFKEPGFVVGLNVIKPKVYIKDQVGGLSSFMETLENWLPALSHQQFEKGFISFAANAGPLASKIGTTPFEAYWVDLRDLLLYGDQFLNFAPDTSTSALSVFSGVADEHTTRYPKPADIDSLFVTSGDYIQSDGVVDVNIAGRQQDRTPRGQYL